MQQIYSRQLQSSLHLYVWSLSDRNEEYSFTIYDQRGWNKQLYLPANKHA